MKILIIVTALLPITTLAQNVGIGTTTPTGPLSFANSLGNKLVLWGDGNTAHYGIGVQSGNLQLYTDLANTNISFGYGSSGAFTHRMKIMNGGGEGLEIKGRVHLKNGTDPIDPAYAAGIWLYKPDNTTAIGFMGVQNNQNIGFYGGSAGWGFTYDIVNSRVGIGNNNPNAPLSFPPSLGKKITLYPGATGDVGFGVAGNRLQIFSDNPNADVAIGYDAAGVFNERFAIKPNGALALQGNTGGAGQILSSTGGGPAFWSNKPSLLVYNQSGNVAITGALKEAVIPGMNGQQFTITQNSRAVFTTTLYLAANAFGSPRTITEVEIKNAANARVGFADSYFQFHDYPAQRITANGATVLLTPGVYTIYVKTSRTSTIDGELYAWTSGGCACQGGQMIMQIIPE